MVPPKTLQQRFTLYMLLPVAILLFGMGYIGFIYAQDRLLEQWGEAAILKLQRAAHHIDMRLSRSKDWLKIFHETASMPRSGGIQQSIISHLEQLEGVVGINLEFEDDKALKTGSREKSMLSDHHMMKFQKAVIAKVKPPLYDPITNNHTISIVLILKDTAGNTIGKLEVMLGFDYLKETILSTGWLQSHKTFIVDDSGKILAGALSSNRKYLGETNDPLELETIEALKKNTSGTVIGRGHPPAEVSGFYRLEEAPWNLVMIAPGKDILSPIISFRWYYFTIGTALILFILFLIRTVTWKTASAIKEVSRSAGKVAKGNFDALPVVTTHDEVGDLIQSFNSMVRQLKERIRLKNTLDLAMDIQQSLLPKSDPLIRGLDIAGKSIYCDETGGDYYDFLEKNGTQAGEIDVIVGDVSDHGIPSALLMATTRASLRQRASMPGSLKEIIVDVNRQLFRDVETSGQFVTLFYTSIDTNKKRIKWVRAGHDPAFIYDRETGEFIELAGKGMALGAIENVEYEEHQLEIVKGQTIVIGTDGIWETQNNDGRTFGKTAFQELVRRHVDKPARTIVEIVMDEVKNFRIPHEQEDDITLVIIKIEEQVP